MGFGSEPLSPLEFSVQEFNVRPWKWNGGELISNFDARKPNTAAKRSNSEV